jgi:hypothetical protein
MKILRVILVVVAVVLLWAIFPPAESAATKHLAEALSAYRDDPSPQNKANLDHIREARTSRELKRELFIVSFLAADIVALLCVSRQIHRNVAA